MKNIIKENLQRIFAERNLTITQVSEESGIAKDTISNLYYGRTDNPRISTINELLEYLQISYEFLIGKKYYNEEKLKLLNNYDACPRGDKILIQEFAERGKRHAQFANNQEHIYEITCIIPTGYFSRDGMLWDSAILVNEQTFYEDVDFAVKLPTNAYVPVYDNNEILFVDYRSPINEEEAVILYKNDKLFIRRIKYIQDTNSYVLKALTQGQNDIFEKTLKEYRILGTILSPERCTRNTTKDGKIKKELPIDVDNIIHKFIKEPN